MKKLVFFAICFAVGISGNAQTVLGKWYGINESGLIEFDISKDTIKTQRLEANEQKRLERESHRHSGIYTLDGRVLIVVPDKTTDSSYRALTIFEVKDKVSFEIAANGINVPAKTIDELLTRNKKDTTKLFGNILLHIHIKKIEKY